MQVETDRSSMFDPSELKDSEVLLYSVSFSGNGYGRDKTGTNEGSIFFHQSMVNRFNMAPGDVFRVRYVPNYPDRIHTVQWRAIYVFSPEGTLKEERAPAEPAPAPAPKLDLKAETEKYALDGQVWNMREVFYNIFKRDPDYKVHEDKLATATIGNHLRALCREDKLWRAELFKHSTESAYAVYFCTDPDRLKPEGF